MSKFELSVAINRELERIGLCAFIFEGDITSIPEYIKILDYLKSEQ